MKKIKNIPMCVMMLDNFIPRFSNSKKKAAEYIIKNYVDIINLNITELADRGNTSTSTIVRLCRDLGFKKFQDFKLSLAQELNNPTYKIHEALEKDDDLDTIKKKVFKSNVDAINSTLNVFSEEIFSNAVKLIKEAEHIEFYGFGGSCAVALDAVHKFLKIGIKCQAISDNDIQAMSASLLKHKDLIIAISHTGRNKALLSNLSIAKETGAKIIAITNFGKSPILKYADVALFTSSKETAFKSDAMSSRIAELTIIDALFVAVAYLNYDKSNENIAKTRGATLDKKI